MLHEIGADELPLELRAEQDRRGRPARVAAGSRTASPRRCRSRRSTGEGLDELRARIAERFADRFEAVRLFVPYDEGGKLAELYALGAPIDEREDTRTACTSARGSRAASCAASRGTSSPRRARSRRRRVIELPIQRLRDDAVVPERAYAATPASTSRPASASSSAPASEHWSARGSPSRSRRATRASSSHVQGSPPATASRS